MQNHQKLSVTLFGGSHEREVGVTMDGVPAGMRLEAADFATDIARRASGAAGTTLRREADVPQFVSGGAFEDATQTVFITDGTPLTISFENNDFDDAAYAPFSSTPRPGHADWVALRTCGSVPPGGGRASGRMTLPMVAAGVVAKKLLPGLDFKARLVEVGGSADPERWPGLIEEAVNEGDSLGGVVECVVSGRTPDGIPIGLGGDFLDSVESQMSAAMFAIPGVRGVEFGDGFAAARMKGSGHNDPIGPDGPLKNGSGGVNGGRTNGRPIVFRVAFKPASSISKPQRTWNFEKHCYELLRITGRHDSCFALRTPAVVEGLAAIVIFNLD